MPKISKYSQYGSHYAMAAENDLHLFNFFSSNDPVKKGAVLIELWGYEIISFSYGIDMLNLIMCDEHASCFSNSVYSRFIFFKQISEKIWLQKVGWKDKQFCNSR